MGQAEGQTESENRALPRRDEGRGHRTKVGFADESAEGCQVHLRSRRRVRDQVNRASDQRPARKRQRQRRQSAGGSRRDGDEKAPPASRRGQTTVRMGCCEAVSRAPRLLQWRALRGRRRYRRSRRRAPRGSIGRAIAAAAPATPPPTAAPHTNASMRRERAIDSATDSPAPTPAPPAAPQHPPMTASTGTTPSEAALPGAARSISPPTAPPRSPERPPPIDAPAQRAAASAAARRSLSLTNSRAVANGAGSPSIGTSTGLGHVPAGVAQQRACECMARAGGEPPQRLGRAERVQQLRRFAAVLFVARTGGDASEALQERLVRI